MTFQRGPLRCFKCNRLRHMAKDCRVRPTAAMEFQEYPDFYPQQEYQYPSYSQSSNTEETDEYNYQEEIAAAVSYTPKSTFGNRPSSYPSYSSYPATSAPVKSNHPPVPKPRYPAAPTFRPSAPSNTSSVLKRCRQHNIVDCGECNYPETQTHHCQALVAVCQECGQQHPVITDACQSLCKNLNMPMSEGLLENQPVKVLRDSGCSTVVVRRSLVPEDKLTGHEERCILIDGTVRRTPVAEIFIDTPYYTGITTAVCKNNPVYDLIIGNVPGSTCLSFTSSRNRRRRYNSRRPWFFHKRKKDQAFREL